MVIACVGGGSNAIGIFSGFMKDEKVELVGVEGGGNGTETVKNWCNSFYRNRKEYYTDFIFICPSERRWTNK